MVKKQSSVLIAGIRGGCGKSTVTLSIISALRKDKGLKVAPFKKGPDYIDSAWMSLAAQSPCYNLDPFLLSDNDIVTSYCIHSNADISIIEGNRGVHDGKDMKGSCSTASIAKLLKVPIILVVDVTKVTRTAAAIVLGCMRLDEAISIKAVIINQVSGSRHEKIIRQSIEHYCGIPVIGAIPRLDVIHMPERHMGLTPMHEYTHSMQYLQHLAESAQTYFDIDAIIKISQTAESLTFDSFSFTADNEHTNCMFYQENADTKFLSQPSFFKDNKNLVVSDLQIRDKTVSCKIGIFMDPAFQFYYAENIQMLTTMGAEIVAINALIENKLPDIDCLYIGGGFPETHAMQLSSNTALINSLKERIEDGLPVYAECGGLMFLGKDIDIDGHKYRMADILPFSFVMKKRPHAHGYTEAQVVNENLFYKKGLIIKGHEFHYSEPFLSDHSKQIYFALHMKRGTGIMDGKDGVCYKNVFAAYTHIHAYGTPQWAEGMIKTLWK